jgi:hypothetical protein
MACGERVLLPKVREASPQTLVVSDGFSCRSQIEQGDTGRGALHLAQVIKLAREHGGIPGPLPEREYQPAAGRSSFGAKAAVLGAVAVAAGIAAAWVRSAR